MINLIANLILKSSKHRNTPSKGILNMLIQINEKVLPYDLNNPAFAFNSLGKPCISSLTSIFCH